MVNVVLLTLINFSFYSGNYQAKISRVVNLFVHENLFLLWMGFFVLKDHLQRGFIIY